MLFKSNKLRRRLIEINDEKMDAMRSIKKLYEQMSVEENQQIKDSIKNTIQDLHFKVEELESKECIILRNLDKTNNSTTNIVLAAAVGVVIGVVTTIFIGKTGSE